MRNGYACKYSNGETCECSDQHIFCRANFFCLIQLAKTEDGLCCQQETYSFHTTNENKCKYQDSFYIANPLSCIWQTLGVW